MTYYPMPYLNKKFDVEDYLSFQSEEDELTEEIYKKDEKGLIIFPLRSKKGTPYHGHLGEQTSRYHHESIAEHIKMTVEGMLKENLQEFNNEEIILLGMLHDAGKKYTGGTNVRGEICFYGHEKISADIACQVYDVLGYTKEKSKIFIDAIAGHMLPMNAWNNSSNGEKQKQKWILEHGENAFDLLMLIHRNDIGITEQC